MNNITIIIITIFSFYFIGAVLAIFLARQLNKIVEQSHEFYTSSNDAPIVFCLSWLSAGLISIVYIYNICFIKSNIGQKFKRWLEL